MPQTPTTYMLLVQPTEGGDDDVWDTLLTALFLLIDAHDHTTGKGKPLGSASITIDAALDFHDFRITSVGGVDLTNLGAALTTGANEVFAFGGNLYYRSGGGSNVQITNGGALNMTTVGGIGGDYTSASALFEFTDAADGYFARQQVGAAVRQYGRMNSADVRLYEFKAHPAAGVPTTFVGLASPAGLAGSYTLTFPAALPASTVALQVTAAGAVLASNTFPTLITASAGITLAANQNLTLSGTGEYKHGDRHKVVNGQIAASGLTAGVAAWEAISNYQRSLAAGSLYASVPFLTGDRIKSITVKVFGDATATLTWTANVSSTAMVDTGIGTVAAFAPAAAWADSPLDVTDTTLAAGESLRIVFTANNSNVRIGSIDITYDHP